MSGRKTILVTGGAGFIGSNLADRLASEGHRVRVLDALTRPGVEANLEWLTQRHGDAIEPLIHDLREGARIPAAIAGVDAVFHLAAQVAVTTSLADPRADFAVNAAATFDLLEAVRLNRPDAPFVFASTNKVYGNLSEIELISSPCGYVPADYDLAEHGIGEQRPLEFHTPYGCSKGAADQYVLDYARSFGLRASVLRMSCIYGRRQMGSEDQGWVAHFLIRALAGEPITIYGDGQQVRDVCDVDDACDAYLAAMKHIDEIAGYALNWGGGPDNAVSLLTVIEQIAAIIGRTPDVRFADWRLGDQRWFVSDTRLADRLLGLRARKPWQEGLRDLGGWLQAEGRTAEISRPEVARSAAS